MPTIKQIISPTPTIRDVVLHSLITRAAYTDNHNEEFRAKLSNNVLEIDIPQDRLDELTNVIIGPKAQQFIDWLTKAAHADNLPIATRTTFGIVEIGSGINVANGVISVTGTVGETIVTTSSNYTIINNPTVVIATGSIIITLPSSATAGWRVEVKNATASSNVIIPSIIDGVNTLTIYPKEAYSLIYDGNGWYIL